MTRSASRSLQQGVILWLAFCIVIIGTAVIDASRLPLLFIPLSSWLACYGAGMGLDWPSAILTMNRHQCWAGSLAV